MTYLIYHVIAVFVVGFAAALLIYLLKHTFKLRWPGYVYPIAVGLAMLGYNVWAEYTWYNRTAAALPKHAHVANTFQQRSYTQPWTLLLPSTNRIVVVDLSTRQKNPNVPGYAISSVLLVERFEDVIVLNRFFDCEGSRVADLGANPEFSDDGLPKNVSWLTGQENESQLEIVCAPDAEPKV